MELSDQIHKLQLHVRDLKRQNEGVGERSNWMKNYDGVLCNDDLINIDEIDFSNDENWLCGNSGRSDIDLTQWLHDDKYKKMNNIDGYQNHLSTFRDTTELKKIIDTRTFTRPKKKYNRPSIEHYTEEMYDLGSNSTEDVLQQEIQNYISSSKCTDSSNTSIISDDSCSRYNTYNKPLHFDLNQTSSTNIFDNILMNASDIDSFQNMSPPSLVNSMCSSTFTNLMESSFIKNDPALREIRDADYSGEILMHDTEPQLYQSFTESCSSLNSDSAENFLRRTLPTLNGTFNLQSQNSTYNSDSDVGNTTLTKQDNTSDNNQVTFTNDQLNGTFIRQDVKELNYPNNLNSSYVIQGNLNNSFKRNLTKDISYDNMNLSSNSDVQCDSGNKSINTSFKKPQNDQFMKEPSEIEATYNIESNNASITDVYFNNTTAGSAAVKTQQQQQQQFDKSHSENIDPNTTINIKHPIIMNGAFRKAPNFANIVQQNIHDANSGTFIANQLNKTMSLENDLDDPLNVTIGYNITDEADDLKNCSYNQDTIGSKTDVKRNSAGYVTGSTDSLDHMSSLSNSSRGSNRMLNMAEVDAIVEEQERSLHVASTPKPAKSMTKLFEAHYISPIARQKEHVSDSDLSSTEDYLTVRSTLSKGSSGHSEKNLKILDRNVKSLSNLKQNLERLKAHNVHTITRPVSNVKPLIGSYTNLRSPPHPESNIRGSYTNLKTLGSTLKGSYTNLKPIGVNLPVISSKPSSAPISGRHAEPLDQTHTISNTHKDEVFKIPHAPPAQVKSPTIPNSVKSQARGSCLPRPISTGIPRPVSKIPGPRMLRPPSAKAPSRLANKPTDGY